MATYKAQVFVHASAWVTIDADSADEADKAIYNDDDILRLVNDSNPVITTLDVHGISEV